MDKSNKSISELVGPYYNIIMNSEEKQIEQLALIEQEDILKDKPRKSFVDDVQIKIFNGTYQPGDKLPSERDLAAFYKTSKTVVHDGLLSLVNQGFLIAQPRRGYYIADYKKTGNIAVLNAYLSYNSNHLDEATFDALIEAILAIEGSALVKLATNKTEDDLKVLKSYYRKLKAIDPSAIDAMATIFSQFHHEITYGCKNIMFPLLFNSFDDLLMAFYKAFIQEYGKENALKVIKYLIHYIQQAEGQKAYNLLGNLLRQFRIATRAHQKGN